MKRTTFAIIIGAMLFVGGGYLGMQATSRSAHADDIQSAIDARHALMKDNGAKMKAMSDAIKANSTDMAALEQLALGIQANAARIPDLFPAGSSMKDFPDKNFAKPEIWDNFDAFKAAAATLSSEAGKLAEAAKSGDMAAFSAQFEVTGSKGCGGCHSQFRQKM